MKTEALLATSLKHLGDAQRRLAQDAPAKLDAWLTFELERCRDESFAQRFAAACPVPEVPASAYNAQLLEAPGGPTLLTGIRFKGGDVSQPFVDLLAWDRSITDVGAWRSVLARVRDHFGAFSPRHVRLRWPGERVPPLGGELEADQVLNAGRLSALSVRERTPSPLRVERVWTCDWYDDFHRAYIAWTGTSGSLADEVFASSRAELERCLETGAVVCAFHDGTWVGVAAAAAEEERVLSGYVVMEELLASPVRGRGWGAVLQRGLIDALAEGESDAVLWGTIHGSNVASRRTAEKCGREVVETWWFSAL